MQIVLWTSYTIFSMNYLKILERKTSWEMNCDWNLTIWPSPRNVWNVISRELLSVKLNTVESQKLKLMWNWEPVTNRSGKGSSTIHFFLRFEKIIVEEIVFKVKRRTLLSRPLYTFTYCIIKYVQYIMYNTVLLTLIFISGNIFV